MPDELTERAREYAKKSPWQVDAESLADFAKQEVQRERIAAVRGFIRKLDDKAPSATVAALRVFKEMFPDSEL